MIPFTKNMVFCVWSCNTSIQRLTSTFNCKNCVLRGVKAVSLPSPNKSTLNGLWLPKPIHMFFWCSWVTSVWLWCSAVSALGVFLDDDLEAHHDEETPQQLTVEKTIILSEIWGHLVYMCTFFSEVSDRICLYVTLTAREAQHDYITLISGSELPLGFMTLVNFFSWYILKNWICPLTFQLQWPDAWNVCINLSSGALKALLQHLIAPSLFFLFPHRHGSRGMATSLLQTPECQFCVLPESCSPLSLPCSAATASMSQGLWTATL